MLRVRQGMRGTAWGREAGGPRAHLPQFQVRPDHHRHRNQRRSKGPRFPRHQAGGAGRASQRSRVLRAPLGPDRKSRQERSERPPLHPSPTQHPRQDQVDQPSELLIPGPGQTQEMIIPTSSQVLSTTHITGRNNHAHGSSSCAACAGSR